MGYHTVCYWHDATQTQAYEHSGPRAPVCRFSVLGVQYNVCRACPGLMYEGEGSAIAIFRQSHINGRFHDWHRIFHEGGQLVTEQSNYQSLDKNS